MIENIELQELQKSDSDSAPVLEKRDLLLCGHVNTKADVLVCSIEITISELFGLKIGDVVKSSQNIEHPMTLMVNGKPVARGNLVAIDDKFGFEVTQLGE
jgi:flagellar motor switch protein FliN/FliY